MLVRSQGKNRIDERLASAGVATGVVIPAERSGQPERPGILPCAQAVDQRGMQILDIPFEKIR